MRRLLSPAWVARHLAAAVLVGSFLALGWWQMRRAAGGNALSWGYMIQWPVFAGFVAFIWYREIRAALRGGHAPARSPSTHAPPARRPVVTARRTLAGDDDSDPELVAYNKYLAWLNANPQARPTDYPG